LLAPSASPDFALSDLEQRFALCVAGVFTPSELADYQAALYRARDEWVRDFDGEQFCFGRAFYTHFEQDRCQAYFADACASDQRVERHLPGMQQRMLALVERVTGGQVFPRRGFCGPGVHIFPAGEKVAREGGVIHFDTEGLTPEHSRKRKRALSVVVMLSQPEAGGGLKLWAARYTGRDAALDSELSGPSSLVSYDEGTAVVFDSFRLHQIQPFEGTRDRVTATVHAAEVDPGRWETWF